MPEIENFETMNSVQQLKIISELLDQDVRPMLVMDGGDMEIIDLKEEGGALLLFIQYLGACQGCPISSTGTLTAIQQYLNVKVSERIEVVPV